MKKTISRRLISLFSAFLLLAAFLLAASVHVQAMSCSETYTKSYTEYMDIIKGEPFKENFIHYKHVKCLGEFHFFSMINATTDMYLNGITYGFTDKNNAEILLNICAQHSFGRGYDSLHYESELMDQPNGMTSMRTLGTATNGAIRRGSLTYYYFDGNLRSIHWKLGDLYFELNSNLHTYPMNGKRTIVSRLLSINEHVAESAYRTMIADIPALPGYYTPLIVDGIVILCVTAGVCVAAVIITKRIRKRRMAQQQANNPSTSASME